MDQLIDEIRRILHAPYAISLKRLHDIIQQLDEQAIARWAVSHACEVHALTHAVIDGLSSCLYALPVLEKLVSVPILRDAVLERPVILDQFLKRGAATKDSFEKHKRICNAMLAVPLPLDVPYPAAIVPFFLESLKQSLSNPSPGNLRLTYTLVSRQCFEMLKGSLPGEQITQLEEKLINILGQPNKQPVHLVCLGIFARLISSADGAPYSSASLSCSRNNPSAEVADKLGVLYEDGSLSLLRKFFSGSRAHKTVGLVVLRAVEACTSNNGLNSEGRLEALRLAKVAMDVVEPQIKDTWMKENKTIMQKLHEKVLRNCLGTAVQSAAFDFLLCLVDAKSLPYTHVQAFQDLIRSGFENESEENPSICVSLDTLEQVACYFDERFVHEALRAIFDAVLDRDDPTVPSLIRFKDYQTLLCGFGEAVVESLIFRSALLSPLRTNEISRLLREFCRCRIPDKLPTDNCTRSKSCWTEFHESRRRVAASLCQLILKAALHSAGDDFGIDLLLTNNLLKKLEDFATPLPPCLSRDPGRQTFDVPLISLLEQPCTPQTNRASIQWKNRLAKDLRDAAQQHQLIIRTVGNVCKDLEERCDDSEAPLLKEKERLANAEANLDEARQEIIALKSEEVERKLFLDGLEAENLRLEDCLEASNAKADFFQKRALDLERLLQEANKNIHETQTVNLQEAKDREIAHMASLIDKGQTIAELERQVEILQQELDATSKGLENCTRKRDDLDERLLKAENMLCENSVELESMKEINDHKAAQILNLDEFNGQLKEKIAILEQNLGKSLEQLKEIECETEETKRSLKVEMDLMKRDWENCATEAATQMAGMKQLHSSEMNKVKLLLQELRDCLASERQEHKETVFELENEIKRLSRERNERAKEFAEAQELSKKLIAVMGIKESGPRPFSITSMEENEFPDSFLASPILQRGKPSLGIAASGSDKRNEDISGKNDKLTRPFDLSPSSRSGPTPKRPRIRKSIKSPGVQPSKIKHGMKTKTAIQSGDYQSSRCAMKDISTDSRNKPVQVFKDTTSKSAHQTPADVSIDRSLGGKSDEFGDFSFTESELFASTQLYEDKPTGHKSMQDLELSGLTTDEL